MSVPSRPSDGILEIEELRTVGIETSAEAPAHKVVVGRQAEILFDVVDPNTHMALITENIPYGAKLFFNSSDFVTASDVIFRNGPFNAVIVAESTGKLTYEDVIEGVTYRSESDSM